MSKKRMLADVLWEAANYWLMTRASAVGEIPLEYSCNAAQVAEAGQYTRGMFTDRSQSRAVKFLAELGCDTSCGTLFEYREDAQGDRYMWLLLAMHVAEDEGIEL